MSHAAVAKQWPVVLSALDLKQEVQKLSLHHARAYCRCTSDSSLRIVHGSAARGRCDCAIAHMYNIHVQHRVAPDTLTGQSMGKYMMPKSC
jgi:hypothetical protein